MAAFVWPAKRLEDWVERCQERPHAASHDVRGGFSLLISVRVRLLGADLFEDVCPWMLTWGNVEWEKDHG